NNNKTTGLAGQGNSLSTFEDVLTIEYQKWGHTFTSVSGFYSYHSESKADYADLPSLFFTSESPEKFHQFSQELRVASSSDQPIEYMVGGYFQTDHITFPAEANGAFLNFLGPLIPPLAPYLPYAAQDGFMQGEHVYSMFASTSWKVTDRLKLKAGLRRSRVSKDITASAFIGHSDQTYGGAIPDPPAILSIWESLGIPAPLSLHYRPANSAWMPSAGIQYQ